MRMKKIFSLLLCLALMVTLLPGAAFAEDGEAVLTDPAQTETVVEEEPATGLELAAGYAAGKTSANAETDVAAPQVEENASLFDKLMACSDLASAQALIEASSENELNALTEEQNAQLDEKFAELAAQAAQAASAAPTESATPENSEECSAESAMEPIVSYRQSMRPQCYKHPQCLWLRPLAQKKVKHPPQTASCSTKKPSQTATAHIPSPWKLMPQAQAPRRFPPNP